jgi:ankyrin repeat protein
LYIGDREDIYNSPLLVATEDGDLRKVKSILASGVPPDSQRGNRGSTALAVAVNHKQHKVLRELLNAGADPDFKCGEGTPLESSIWAGDLTAYNLLREKSKLPRSSGGWSLLYIACSSNASDHQDNIICEMVMNLLRSGQNPNELIPDGDTCLNSAIERGRVRVVIALLEAGANPSIPNSKNETAVDVASRQLNWFQTALVRDRSLLEKLKNGEKGIYDAEFLNSSIDSDLRKIATYNQILLLVTQGRIGRLRNP